MGLDLTKLNELVKVADQAGNKDGKLNVENKKEISVFEEELAKLGLSKEEEQNVYELMGLKKTPTSRKERKALKHENERKEDYTLRQLGNVVNAGVEPNKTIEALNERLGVSANDPKYKELAAEVQYVLNLVPSYNSKDEVENIHNTVKKELKAAGKWDDMHKDILEQLEVQAESTPEKKRIQ